MSDLHLFTAAPRADAQHLNALYVAKPKRTHRIEWPSLIVNLSFFLMGAVLPHIVGW